MFVELSACDYSEYHLCVILMAAFFGVHMSCRGFSCQESKIHVHYYMVHKDGPHLLEQILLYTLSTLSTLLADSDTKQMIKAVFLGIALATDDPQLANTSQMKFGNDQMRPASARRYFSQTLHRLRCLRCC